ASVGVEPTEHDRVRPAEKIEVNGRTLSSPRGFTLVRHGRLREVSITPLGADANTSVSIAASRNSEKGFLMDTDVQVDEQAIRASERERLKQIEGICQMPNGGWGAAKSRVEELKASAISGDITVESLAAELLNVLRESRPKVNTVWQSAPVGG